VSPRLTAFILMCLPLAAMAQIYQYKDAQGRMVFLGHPAPGRQGDPEEHQCRATVR
jgi:hypothetical protein